MIVYLITNLENENQYVGQTIKSLEHRWYQHVYDASRLQRYPIHKAIQKYGSDKFSLVTLHACESKEEMDFVETFYIQLLKTKSPNGYNVLDTASITGAHLGHKHSEETKKRFKEVRKGRKPWNKGVKMSPEVCEANRQAHLGIPWKEGRNPNNGWLGRSPSVEHRLKISLAKKGKGLPWSPKRRELWTQKKQLAAALGNSL